MGMVPRLLRDLPRSRLYGLSILLGVRSPVAPRENPIPCWCHIHLSSLMLLLLPTYIYMVDQEEFDIHVTNFQYSVLGNVGLQFTNADLMAVAFIVSFVSG